MTRKTDDLHTQDPELDTLIGRLVDGEVSSAEIDRFEQKASREAALWRMLALRQLDMTMLSKRVLDRTEAAERVEPPSRGRRRPGWAVTISGWAAVLVVLVAWWAVDTAALRTGTDRSRAESAADDATFALTPQDHLRRYLEAEFVVGELDRVMLGHERQPDGRHRVRFMRRIEEWVDIDQPPQSIIDHRQRLTIDPSELRDRSVRSNNDS